MARTTHSNLILATAITLTVLTTLAQGLPKRMPLNMNDEDERDRRMHPDLPEIDARASPRLIFGEDTNDYWRDQGKAFIKKKLSAKINTNRAKNVIMFLGDGLGFTTLASARMLLGGEEKSLAMESFPFTGLSKTYSVDKIVPDSACTATAYLTGVKAMEGTIGVNGNVDRESCETGQITANHVFSIAKAAMDSGKSAGVVTTTRITHASPAGVYAHIAEREWENDSEVKASCGSNTHIEDIAYQLVHGEVGSKLKLVMGGGKKNFIDSKQYGAGKRSDGRNLIDDYKKQSPKNVFIETRAELMNANLKEADRFMGLFHDDHLLYHLETDEHSNQPTLEEMTRKAIEYLSDNENGYFIFIEGGRIDLAHHDNLARIALDETVEFSKAIQAARDLTNEEDTLIVVTADHSHAFSYAGYPYRGNDIFGRAPANPEDKKPYLTLSYSNGPSYEAFFDVKKNERRDPTKVLTGKVHDTFPAMFPRDSETHGGEDVPVFALGPWSHLFTGVYEQNTIPHMMAYASCLGGGLTTCSK